jgi:uncharacterized membrane-anchored protein
MNQSKTLVAILALMASSAALAQTPPQSQQQAQDDYRAQMRALPWKVGPTTGDLEGKAKLNVPAQYRFLDAADGGKFLKLTGNLPHDENILAGQGWWAVLGFDPVGYVKDDETIDADKLLATLKSHDDAENAERKKLGEPGLHTIGWSVPPHYDAQSKHLEWGLKIRADDSNEEVVNYTVRLLGRSGYESATLVTSPETLDRDVASFKTALAGFDFNSGEKYSEFRAGDHVAEFGLGALVLGGAAAVAAKTGFWKVLLAGLAAGWKAIAVAVAAAGAAIKKLFTRKPSI